MTTESIDTIPQLTAMIADKNARLAEQGRLQDLADRHLADSRTVTILDNDEDVVDAEFVNPLAAQCYCMSGPHLSGYRLCIGFETLQQAQDAHEYVARITTA